MTESAVKLALLLKEEAAQNERLSAIRTEIDEQRAKLQTELTAMAPPHQELRDFFKYEDTLTHLIKVGQAQALLVFKKSGLAHPRCLGQCVSGPFSREALALLLLRRLKTAWAEVAEVEVERFPNCYEDHVVRITFHLL